MPPSTTPHIKAERIAARISTPRGLLRRRVHISKGGATLTADALRRTIQRLTPLQAAQLAEVLQRVEALTPPQSLDLSLEACLSRFIPASDIADNLALLETERHTTRAPMVADVAAQARARYQVNLPPPSNTCPPLPDVLIERVAQARRITWILGAGISVGAGIPTYRGATSAGGDPLARLMTLPAYLANPDLVWATINVFRDIVSGVDPTPAHDVIARFNARADRNIAITQNVDGLEARAGAEAIHMHGRLHGYRCLKEEADKTQRDPRYNDASFPICPDCGALLKPGVVFFFEGLAADRFDRALDILASSDVVFEVGTSRAVYPVAHFWKYAKMKGATLVVINPTPDLASQDADYVLAADCQAVLTRLWEHVEGQG